MQRNSRKSKIDKRTEWGDEQEEERYGEVQEAYRESKCQGDDSE